MEEFSCLCFFLLSLTEDIALEEFHQIGELEFFLAGMLEDLAPLLIGLQEELLPVELIPLE